MSDIDASNVTVINETTDPATGDLVVTTDGVETRRVARPDVKNDLDLTAWLSGTYIPAMRVLKSNADGYITAGQTVKNLPVTTVAEARTAIRDLADVVIDLARATKDVAAGEIKSSRKLLAEFDGQD